MGLLHKLHRQWLVEMGEAEGPTLEKVDWQQGNAGDWRDHVPPQIQEIWGRLSGNARLTGFIVASFAARRAAVDLSCDQAEQQPCDKAGHDR